VGSGIAGKRRLPRQGRGNRIPDDAGASVDEQTQSHVGADHSTDLVSPQPLSYEERRDRWLRITGNLWRTGSESPEEQRI